MPDELVHARLVDIEVALTELGFAAVADPEGCAVLIASKSPSGPDPHALWRLLSAPRVVSMSERELSSEDYLLIALEKVAGKGMRVDRA